MKLLLTTHAQMFRCPDGSVWTGSVYGYNFFKRYLGIFESVRLVTRMKDISLDDVHDKIRVDGEGLEFYPLPFYHGPWQYAQNFFKIKAHFAEAILGCDCAILRIPDQISFQLFNKIKKEKLPCGVEVVAFPWDLFAKGTSKSILRPLLRVLWDYQQKLTCKKADGVAYVTRYYIQSRYPAKIKENDSTRFETYYTDTNLTKEFFYRPRNLDDFGDNTKIVHIGIINNAAKGHEELLHAIAKLKQDNIIINAKFIGGGSLQDYYIQLSKELDIFEQVEFMGFISKRDDITNILKESNIFVLPTMTEGLPRVVLEAMAAGLPCIATGVGGIPELLSARCLVNVNDISGLAKKLEEFILNKDIMVQESQKNYDKAKQYSAENIKMKMDKFYKKLYLFAHEK